VSQVSEKARLVVMLTVAKVDLAIATAPKDLYQRVNPEDASNLMELRDEVDQLLEIIKSDNPYDIDSIDNRFLRNGALPGVDDLCELPKDVENQEIDDEIEIEDEEISMDFTVPFECCDERVGRKGLALRYVGWNKDTIKELFEGFVHPDPNSLGLIIGTEKTGSSPLNVGDFIFVEKVLSAKPIVVEPDLFQRHFDYYKGEKE